jgi:outer membrane protein assembly factor BamB
MKHPGSATALFWILCLSLAGLGSIYRLNAQAASQDWPRFRGPGGQGVSGATGLPVTWGPDQNVLWKTALPGAGTSSPIVVGDKIFLTCFSGFNVPGEPPGEMEQLTFHVVCLERESGKIVWDSSVQPVLPEQPDIRDNHGYASSTPAADGDRLFVFFGRSGVFAFDFEGKQLWRTEVGSNLHNWGSGASPVLYRDLVIINASVESERLIALSKKTGDMVWSVSDIREAWNTPVLVTLPGGGTELVMARMGQIAGFDPAEGSLLWTCENDIRWYIVPSIVSAGGIVWSLGGRSGIVAAAVQAGGRGDVTQSRRLWTSRRGSNVSSPIVHDGLLFWMHDNRGIAYCAEAMTGEIRYEERIDGAGQVYASPILAEGRLYYVSRSGRTFVIAAKPQFELIAVNDLGDSSTFNASPVPAGDRLLLRSDKFLYCLGEE